MTISPSLVTSRHGAEATMTSDRRPDATDRLVGTRIKLRRQSISMSQTKLAEKVGVTYQQLNKYEQGLSRISASRLALVAKALGVPITSFFDDLKPVTETADEKDTLIAVLGDRMTVELIKAFAAVPDAILRRRILDFVKTASGTDPGDLPTPRKPSKR